MDPFVGEIRVFGFNYAPNGWAFCAGQTLRIAQFTALYSVLGTQFGGDGRTTFGLPNFQGKVGVNQGQGNGLSNYYMGATAGATAVTLSSDQMAAHSHTLFASSANGTSMTANGNVLAVPFTGGGRGQASLSGLIYSTNAAAASTSLSSTAITASGASGASGAHNNMQPTVVLNFCIALQGVYPSRP